MLRYHALDFFKSDEADIKFIDKSRTGQSIFFFSIAEIVSVTAAVISFFARIDLQFSRGIQLDR